MVHNAARTFEVSFLGPTETKGSRVKITDYSDGKSKQIPWDFAKNSVKDVAVAYLSEQYPDSDFVLGRERNGKAVIMLITGKVRNPSILNHPKTLEKALAEGWRKGFSTMVPGFVSHRKTHALYQEKGGFYALFPSTKPGFCRKIRVLPPSDN